MGGDIKDVTVSTKTSGGTKTIESSLMGLISTKSTKHEEIMESQTMQYLTEKNYTTLKI